MSQGKLQQVANPRDIYNNPVNGFVASFVGENNILTGDLQNPSGGMASFATAIGTFKARLGPDATGQTVKLYIRPEHMALTDAAGAENAVAVTVSNVSFEGSFISVQAKTENGTVLVAELRNDGSATVPAIGSGLFMSFDAVRSAILPDTKNGA